MTAADASNDVAIPAEGAPAVVVEVEEETTAPPSSSSAATACAVSPPSSVFLRGLRVLSPRQKRMPTTISGSGGDNGLSAAMIPSVAVALPPLRPEEPVASVRGALGEVVGFAHLTRYRLVAERLTDVDDDDDDQQRATTKGTKGSSSMLSTVWSPFTLKDAEVTFPPSRSLKAIAPPAAAGASSAPNAVPENENEEEEEIVLDEYSDLSALLPLLGYDADAHDADTSSSVVVAGADGRTMLDASRLALRVVLERYDAASAEDHAARVRRLLRGNAPYASSLEGEEEESVVSEEVAAQGGEVAAGDAQAKKGQKGEEKETDESPVLASDAAAASSLPSYPPNYDLSVASCAREGDLSDFYYHACGEEGTLLRLREERAACAKGAKGPADAEDWLLQESGVNGTTTGNGATGKGKNRRNKGGKNNNNSNNNNNKGKGRKKGRDAQPPDNGKAAGNNVVAIVHKEPVVTAERTLYELNEAARVDATVRPSCYHPPPPHRRVLGDLAYLEATFPDGSTAHVTAFPLGFYVNRSTAVKFDPTPSTSGKNNNGNNNDACRSHALLDCLLRRSSSLRSAWTAALSAASKRSDLLRELSLGEGSSGSGAFFRPAVSSFPENGSGPTGGGGGGGTMGALSAPSTFVPRIDAAASARPAWLVPLPSRVLGDFVGPKIETWDHGRMHRRDDDRAEEERDRGTMTFGTDLRGGGPRDWNEELQTAREMPQEEFGERIERARLVHKVLTDFGDAALAGVKAILDGYILPMNPNEPLRSHVYLHNNIFFSRAVDSGLDTFKIVQGDAAARKSASRDAHNTGVLHRLDVPGLHTLATVLVERLGTRIVCQSVVPGILHGERSHELLYGAVETLSPLRCDAEMHELLEGSVGEGCMVATRTVAARPLTEEREEVVKKHRIAPPPPPAAKDGDAEVEEADGNELIRVCGPMEMKGILGSDKRRYVLDCTRLTPRDANWVSKENGGTGRWEDLMSHGAVGVGRTKASGLVPASLDDDEWTVCVLRPELVTNYAEAKINKYLAERQQPDAAKSEGDKVKNDEKGAKEEKDAEKGKEAPDSGKDGEDEESPEEDQNKAVKEKELVSAPETKEGAVADSKAATTQTKESMAEVEEEYIKSLRYNVNVFLPHTRSIESIDEAAHQQLQQDEEEARNLARHLWDVVLPNLTKEIRSSSGNALQLPVDGRSLTELLHQRGVNCRYLGRLADLARKEEVEDVIAAERSPSPDSTDGGSASSQRTAQPRFRMPLCWLEMLECEMVARAAKHVLDSYMQEPGTASSPGASSSSASAGVPAQTVASFISAVLSVGEESAAETERRTAISRGVEGAALDQEDVSALTLYDVGGSGNGGDCLIGGRDEIWADIEREIGRRYRYTLSLYNKSSPSSSKKSESRALYTPLLRRICQRSGIRIVAKRYDLGKKCVCGNAGGGGLSASHPIAPTDVLDILPLVKHAASVAGESFVPCSFDGNAAAGGAGGASLHVLLSDAKTVYEFGHANLSNGNPANVGVALDCAQEAAAMYQRVLESPVHPQISKCLKLTAVAHYHKEEPELAAEAAAKHLAVSVSLHGFDSAEVSNAHLTMADILLGAGKIAEGARHLRAAQFLMEFMAGRNYSGISSTYYRMGSHYYDAGRLEDALRFYAAAAGRRSEDRMFDCLIARNSAGVLARLGRFKAAFEYEKKAYQLYVTFLGEDHDATKACSNTLIQLMKLAVEQQKKSKIEEKERVKENAADAVADQIRADEEAEKAQPTKKKKKHSKKKNKK